MHAADMGQQASGSRLTRSPDTCRLTLDKREFCFLYAITLHTCEVQLDIIRQIEYNRDVVY
jgi:hypothetical protein